MFSKDRIKKLRIATGLTQEKLARELRVCLSTLVKWETGATSPSPMAQERIEEFESKHHLSQEEIKNGAAC